MIHRMWYIIFFMFGVIDVFPQELVKDAINEMINGNIQKYSTKYHEKANGVNIELAVPECWLKKEGVRPHMLNVLSSGQSNKDYSYGCTIGISDEMPENNMSKQDLADIMLQETINSLDTDYRILFSKTTKYDGEYGYIIGYQIITDRAGVSVAMINISHNVLYKNRIATVSCYYGILQSSNALATMKEDIKDFVALSFLIGNSIVVTDKWK